MLNVVAKLAITAAMTAAQMALQMTQRIEGPRLDDLDVTTADYGTVIPRFWGQRRFEGSSIIWAERLREVKTENKTKGGKYDEYKYYGTWAVLICDHEIDAVSRVWMDKHLVYDATSTGPISSFFGKMPDGTRSPVKIQRGRNMRIYLGTETQEADPRMESWCEDRYGANSCPAYKGVSYIVFQDIPLEKFGNRIPQISIEAINSSSDYYPYETKSSTSKLDNGLFNSNGDRLLSHNATSNDCEIWDVPTRTRLIAKDLPVVFFPAVDNSGNIWATDQNTTIYHINGDTMATLATYDAGVLIDKTYCFGTNVYLRPYGGLTAQYIVFDGATTAVWTIPFAPNFYFEDTDGLVWAVGAISGTLYFWTPGSYFSVSTPSTSTLAYAVDNGDGSFVGRHGAYVVLIDKETKAVTATSNIGVGFADNEKIFRNLLAGASSFWIQPTNTTVGEYSTKDLSLIRTMSITLWNPSDDVDNIIYDPINHALITEPQFDTEIAWRYLDRVSSGGVTLESVVNDVAEWCGVTVDASDLTQTVEGYSVTQGSGKDMLAPLLDIHDSIVRPHDFGVEFLQLGGSTQGTLLTEDFVRSGDDARYSVSIQQDTDLPRRITFNFADAGKEQQTNTVISQRPLDSVDGVREQTIDLTTYVLDPADAQKLGDRYFRRLWNSREKNTLGLTAQVLKAEPGDIYTLNLDGVTRTARLDKLTLSGGALQAEWVRDFASLHTLGTGAGASMDGRDDDGIFVPSPSKGFILDIPYLEDVDATDNALVYYGAGPYGNGDWPGAVFAEVSDTGTLSQWNAVESNRKAAWGYSTATLANGSDKVWDRGNSVNINVIGGSLTSCTEADIDKDPTLNLAYLGGELLNFTTATLQGDGTYTISGLKRGRRGTETYTSTHTSSDLFVLLEQFKTDEFGLSDIGSDFSFQVATLGREINGTGSIDLTLAGNNLKPYAPARLKASYNGTDLACTIIRRTRVGGAWIGGTTIPLSENSENYEVDVYNGATLKRTITVTGTNAFTYTSVMASADGITLPAQPTFKCYQMSDAVGRGYLLAA